MLDRSGGCENTYLSEAKTLYSNIHNHSFFIRKCFHGITKMKVFYQYMQQIVYFLELKNKIKAVSNV